MFKKSFILIISIILVIFFTTSCNAEYNKYVKEYREQYNNTINMLDSDKVYKSITDNNLSSNLEQLTILIDKIGNNTPSNKMKELLILQNKQEFVEEIIEKGLRWDSLGSLDKLSIKMKIDMINTIN